MNWNNLDDSPAQIRLLLEERDLALKKRWGQNFMIGRAARERIVAELEPQADEEIWEIGSGLGAITGLVVDRARKVVVFEVDFGLMKVIEERYGDRVTIVAGDAVKTLVQTTSAPDRVVGNLPYRSAAAIVSVVLERPELSGRLRRFVITVQKEMALRMVAGPGTSDYSPFSVLCAVTTSARLAGDLSRGNFFPAPDVVSSIVVMEPKQVDATLRRVCSIAARSLFAQRRKTVANNASNLASALDLPVTEVREAIEAAGIALGDRAEQIPPDGYLEVARTLIASGLAG